MAVRQAIQSIVQQQLTPGGGRPPLPLPSNSTPGSTISRVRFAEQQGGGGGGDAGAASASGSVMGTPVSGLTQQQHQHHQHHQQATHGEQQLNGRRIEQLQQEVGGGVASAFLCSLKGRGRFTPVHIQQTARVICISKYTIALPELSSPAATDDPCT